MAKSPAVFALGALCAAAVCLYYHRASDLQLAERIRAEQQRADSAAAAADTLSARLDSALQRVARADTVVKVRTHTDSVLVEVFAEDSAKLREVQELLAAERAASDSLVQRLRIAILQAQQLAAARLTESEALRSVNLSLRSALAAEQAAANRWRRTSLLAGGGLAVAAVALLAQ